MSEHDHGLYQGAVQQRIDAQCAPRPPRYRNKVTGKRYVLIFEVAGVCELQGLDGRSTYAQRANLGNAEVWEQIA